MKKLILLTICCLVTVWFSTGFTTNLNEDKEKALPKLSDYDFFEGALSDMVPKEGVYPYELNTPLFSDYAHKARFIVLPKGETMSWQEKEVFDMPLGTVIVKHFYYLADERDLSSEKRFIETRLLKNTDKGWLAWGYWWNDEQTDAVYKALGGKTGVTWIDAQGKTREVDYESPNQFQCKSCHSFNGAILPIGPTARQLHTSNRSFVETWAASGLLTGTPENRDDWPSMDWNESGISIEKAARAYLDANCGYCHRHEGPASTSGLFLHYSYPTGPQTGVMKSPVAAGKGSGGLKFDINPGKPEKSILYYRMQSDKPAVRMPEIGRSVADERGLELVKAWISSM